MTGVQTCALPISETRRTSDHKLRAIVIPLEDPGYIAEIGDGCTPLKELVGDNIDAVVSDDDEITLWCAQDKSQDLPVNRLATELWWLTCPTECGKSSLCGRVVVTGGPNPGGDELPVPDYAVQAWEALRDSMY